MADMREYKEVVKTAVAEERQADTNWSWRVASVTKSTAKIGWGYIDYEQALSPEQAASYELTPAKRVAEYIVYRCPDGSLLLDWDGTLWKSGYPAYPKHRCTEVERGYSEGGMALPKLHAAMKEKYLKEGGRD